jgi:folylpolyglutamate synthase/dihydropteroate synthase
MAQLLVQTAHEIVTVTPQNPRSLDAQEYAQTLQEASVGQAAACTVSSASTIKAGVAQVIQRYETLAAKGENPPLICVCGSLYLLGSVMEVLHTTGVVLS